MGTGNTILYWYGACGIFVFTFSAVVIGLMIYGRKRKGSSYRTRSLDPDQVEE